MEFSDIVPQANLVRMAPNSSFFLYYSSKKIYVSPNRLRSKTAQSHSPTSLSYPSPNPNPPPTSKSPPTPNSSHPSSKTNQSLSSTTPKATSSPRWKTPKAGCRGSSGHRIHSNSSFFQTCCTKSISTTSATGRLQ